MRNQIGFKTEAVQAAPQTNQDNPFIQQLVKAFGEFLKEETEGAIFTELRLVKKIEMCRALFAENKNQIIETTRILNHETNRI